MTCGLDCLQVDIPSKTVSLHIPLHRTLSAILQKLILFPWDGFECGFFSVLDFDYTKEEVCLQSYLWFLLYCIYVSCLCSVRTYLDQNPKTVDVDNLQT